MASRGREIGCGGKEEEARRGSLEEISCLKDVVCARNRLGKAWKRLIGGFKEIVSARSELGEKASGH